VFDRRFIVPIDKKRNDAYRKGVCCAMPSGCRAVTASGTTTVWASLAEVQMALGVVASGFLLRGSCGKMGSQG
jgi:hypothetical protein